MNKIKIANIIKGSLVNGEGLRYTIFMQGCSNECDGCQNPETWSPEGGYWAYMTDILNYVVKNLGMLDGVSLSGGDPLFQYDKTLFLCKLLKMFNINIYMWTGYTMEQIVNTYPEILKWVDVIVDGKYEKDNPTKKDLRGSDNQRMFKKIEGRWKRID